MRGLAAARTAGRFDVVHGYEWPPAVTAWLASRTTGVPAVATVLSMSVSPLTPDSMPLVVGTEQIAAAAASMRDGPVATIPPTVDLARDDPARIEPAQWAGAVRLDDGVAYARTGDFDVAILDINIIGGTSFPIAAALAQRGIPFTFCSGYGRR